MGKWPNKDPDEILDFGFNWAPRRLSDDRIETVSAVSVGGSVSVDSSIIASDALVLAYNAEAAAARARGEDVPDTKPGQLTIHWLSGGLSDETCLVRLRVVTEQGRTLEETMSLRIKER